MSQQQGEQSLNALKRLINEIIDEYSEPHKIAKLENSFKEKQLTEREDEVKKKESALKEEESKMMNTFEELKQQIASFERRISNSSTVESLRSDQMVKLNVGGKIFATSLAILRSVKDTFFTGYFNEQFHPKPESDGSFLIDRPFEHFHLILNYLRGIDIKDHLAELTDGNLRDFIEEVVYYQLTPVYQILPRKGVLLLKSKYGIDSCGLANSEFDSKYCSPNISIQNSTRATKKGPNGYSYVLGSESVSSFKVKLLLQCSSLMIGLASRNVKLNEKNCGSYGYFLNCRDGQVYSGNGNVVYKNLSSISDGSIVECSYKDGNLSFSVNGTNHGIAYYNIPSGLFPAFEAYFHGCTFEFID